MSIKFIPIQSAEPEQFWAEVAQWRTSVELPKGTEDRLLDEFIILARRLCLRERERNKRHPRGDHNRGR